MEAAQVDGEWFDLYNGHQLKGFVAAPLMMGQGPAGVAVFASCGPSLSENSMTHSRVCPSRLSRLLADRGRGPPIRSDNRREGFATPSRGAANRSCAHLIRASELAIEPQRPSFVAFFPKPAEIDEVYRRTYADAHRRYVEARPDFAALLA